LDERAPVEQSKTREQLSASGLQEESFSTTRAIWRRFKRNRLATFGAAVLVIMAFMAVLAPVLSPHDPYVSNRNELGAYDVYANPSLKHLLGTDSVGRDVLSRLIYAGRVSLSVGVVAVAISTLIGITIGSIAGFFGGLVDSILMRFTDVVICFPVIFLVITVSTMFPPSIYNVMIVIGAVTWTSTARLVRGEFLRLREMEFVESAHALGAGNARIILRHMLTNAFAPITVAATLGIARAILTEAGLSFLGVGVQQPIASWGNMLNEAPARPGHSPRSPVHQLPWRWAA